MKTYSTKKSIVRRKRIVKKKPSKRVIKLGKRLCEKCGRRFIPSFLVVHHKGHKSMGRPDKPTEGMRIEDFERYYGNHRKRPSYDRRSNVLVLCTGCYEETRKTGKKSDAA